MAALRLAAARRRGPTRAVVFLPTALPFFLLAGLRRGFGLLVSSRYSWNDSRMHSAKNSGSGICSRHDVGEMMILPS
jgi:hypothetical protein